MSGLGRGLDRILAGGSEELIAREAQPAGGLAALLGSGGGQRGHRVRKYVLDVALGAVAEAFGLEGVVIGGAGDAGRPVSIALRVPPSLTADSSLLFEVYGNLWALLHDPGPRTVEQHCFGDRWVCLCPLAGQPTLAAAAFRQERYSETELGGLARSLGAVAAVLDSGTPDVRPPAVAASVSARSPGVSAEVTVDLDQAESGGTTLTGTGHGPTIVAAIAAAAANTCQPQPSIVFAGASELEDLTVTVVMVREPLGAPVLGLSIRPAGDPTGPAEAVFSAMRGTKGEISGRVG